ncbi:hypothetical protein BDR06DRAFT_1008658 [Suillus hirtellus]|nr:hypothetical protein BDR06DRAFT_1008658 [Suillus hirtellus]
MSVDNVDVDMQRHELEDAQTSHDADLFDDNEDDDESSPGNFMDALSQPPSQLPTDALLPTPPTQPPTDALRVRCMVQIDKRAREEVMAEKRRFHEVDFSQSLRQTLYEQQEQIKQILEERVLRQEAQDSLNEQHRFIEEERERHICDVNERTWQWKVALKEREKQEIHAREEQAKKNTAEEMVWREALAQCEAELSTRKDKELAEELARHEEELSARKDNELEERTLERRCLAEELARREAELSERKKQEVEEHKKVIAAEMEQRLHLEIEKLRAEKASELANMEQRFARHTTQNTPETTVQNSLPQVNQKFRKACGATCKMHLVSVAEDNDPMDMHREQSLTVEQEPLRFQLELDDAMSVMENAVSRGIEAALRRIFVDKGLPMSMKRSPQRKRMQDDEVKMERAAELNHERDFLLGEVWRLLKDIFSISQDADFIMHQPAIREDVYSYEYEDGPGPDTKNLAFDLTHGSSMPWNARILDILIAQLQRRNVEEQWLMRRSDGYYKVILEDRYKRL